jgi:uncharacterized protein YbcI
MSNDVHASQVDGPTLARITNGIVRLYAQGYGKGPVQARSYLAGDVLLCVLQDGLTPVELTLVARGQGAAVHTMRRAWQEAMRQDFQEVVERAIGRRVRAFLSQISLDPDVHIEVFMLDPPLARAEG